MEQNTFEPDLESAYHRLTCGIAIVSALSDGVRSNVGDDEYARALWGVSDYLHGISTEIKSYILSLG